MMLNVKSIFLKYRQLIPVIIMLALLIWTFSNAYQIRQLFTDEISGFTLSWQHYLALFCVIINIIIFFKFRRYYKYVLFATLMLGLWNIINFTYFKTSSDTSINGNLVLTFQPVSFLIILITYLTNLKSANKHIFQFIRDLRN
jgi:hypothetical protein